MTRFAELARKIAEIAMPKDPSHGYDHVERVVGYAKRIAEQLRIDLDLEALEVAAWLHDIARGLPEDHAIASADIAYHLLIEHGAPPDFAEKVRRIIMCHSYSARKRGATCIDIEGVVLSDADKIDAVGAVGVARVFIYGGTHGRNLSDSLKHLTTKILSLKRYVETTPAKKIVELRSKRVELFLSWISEELGKESERETLLIDRIKGPSSSS